MMLTNIPGFESRLHPDVCTYTTSWSLLAVSFDDRFVNFAWISNFRLKHKSRAFNIASGSSLGNDERQDMLCQ